MARLYINMKQERPLIIAVIVILMTILIFPVYILAEETDPEAQEGLVEKKKDLETIYSKLEEHREKLTKTRIKEKNVLFELAVLNNTINTKQEKLNYLNYLVKKRGDEIKQLDQDLMDAEYRMESLMMIFRKRLRQIYMTDNAGWLEMLLAADNFLDFITRSYYFEKLIKHDIILINKIKEEKLTIADQKYNIQTKKKEVEDSTKIIIKEKKRLNEDKEKKEQLKKILQKKREQYEREIAELEKNSRQIEQLIKRTPSKPNEIVSTGTFIWPITGGVSSSYGFRKHPLFKTIRFHTGIDIASARGRTIKAADGGKVIFSGRWGGYGKAVIVDHGRGLSTVYAHQSRIYVKNGQQIEQGHVIGLVGTTGYSTGPHLHFEIREYGETVNPMKYLPAAQK